MTAASQRPAEKRAAHVPKHRAPKPALGSTLRRTMVISSAAVGVTAVAVAGGLLATQPTPLDPDLAAAALKATPVATAASDSMLAERRPPVSRSDRRRAVDPAKAAVLSQAEGPAMAETENLAEADPRVIAQALLGEFGFGQDQFGCLDLLYTRESNWRVNADNPYSSAYGIPQALPGSKMSSAGADWATNPVTQIRWGLGYIQDRYGTPCGAWGHSQSHGWY